MNDKQLTRYSAIEARLPEEFPRLYMSSVLPTQDGDWKVLEKKNRDLTDLERLGLAVLVLRAGMRNGHATEDFATAAICERALCGGEGDRIDALLTALESAYPEGTP